MWIWGFWRAWIARGWISGVGGFGETFREGSELVHLLECMPSIFAVCWE